MSETLEQAVRALANMRRDYDKIDAAYKEKAVELEKQISGLKHARETAKNARDDADAEVRRLAAEHPDWVVDGVESQTTTKLTYVDEWAVEWAIFHGHNRLLELGDRKAFEKMVVLAGDLKPKEVPHIRIAKDLSQYLENETDDETAS